MGSACLRQSQSFRCRGVNVQLSQKHSFADRDRPIFNAPIMWFSVGQKLLFTD
jgi:hypothetical protein